MPVIPVFVPAKKVDNFDSAAKKRNMNRYQFAKFLLERGLEEEKYVGNIATTGKETIGNIEGKDRQSGDGVESVKNDIDS